MRRGHGTAGDHDGSYASTITGASAVSACASSPISVFAARPEWAPAGRDPVPVDLLAVLANDSRSYGLPQTSQRVAS
ncbi:MAG: hypothetical protein ACRDSH_25720 [Pseudonocardiaceae bacterium]